MKHNQIIYLNIIIIITEEYKSLNVTLRLITATRDHVQSMKLPWHQYVYDFKLLSTLWFPWFDWLPTVKVFWLAFNGQGLSWLACNHRQPLHSKTLLFPPFFAILQNHFLWVSVQLLGLLFAVHGAMDFGLVVDGYKAAEAPTSLF